MFCISVWKLNKTSIIVDASKYIEELKQKVERLNRNIASTAQNSAAQTLLPVVYAHQFVLFFFSFKFYFISSFGKYIFDANMFSLQQVTVETLEKGFLVNVFSETSCPGLLVSILEAFEELGLNVHDASVSCTDRFQLEAVGGEVRY